MQRLFWLFLLVCLLMSVVSCDSAKNCDCPDDDASPADDDATADDDNDDDSSPTPLCVAGERRCNAADVPEECQDDAWVEMSPCYRMQFCNLGECVNTLLDLPGDENAHWDIVEWWYWTGNMSDDAGNLYGYEVTFFYGASLFGVPAWMMHTAFIDETNGTHKENVWFDIHWPAPMPNGELHLASRGMTVDHVPGAPYEISAFAEDVSFTLTLDDRKGAMHHGGNGSVRMSSRTVDSFYYSRPRLDVEGLVQIGEQTFAATGEAWMDHQWGNFVPMVLIGWDWYSMQFSDDTEIMFFRFRGSEEDPAVTDMALGTYMDANGDQHLLAQEDVQITQLDSWTSPTTGGVYPQNWRVVVPRLGLDVELTTKIADQEVPNPMWNYWEGLMRIDGVKNEEPVTGLGFVELSGYGGRPLFWQLFRNMWEDGE